MAQPKTKGWCKDIEEEIYEITAVITYCRYYNSDTTWGVYGFITEGNIPYYTQPKIDDFMDTHDVIEKKKRQKASVLSGKMQELHIGGEYTIKCTHKFDKTYGHQYNPIAIYPLIPKSEESQLKFLESLIPRTLAKNLTAEYPNIVEDVVKGKITKIDTSKVKGIGELTWIKVREKIIENYVMADILIMLAPLGITYAMIKKLSEDEPNPTLLKQTLQENPYILTRINGMGFKKVDALALKLNPDLLRTPQRLVAFVRHYFQEVGESDGHTWVSEEVVRSAISNTIPECVEHIDWLFDQSGLLHSEHGKVGLKYYYDIEKNIIDYLNNKANTTTKTVFTQEQIDKAIKDAEKEQGFQYSEEQVNVINTILNSTVGVITGRAGCGKTSISRAILKAYQNNHYSIISCALSAMAAKRISEASGYTAATIHRTLGAQGINKFTYNKDNPLIADVVFIDEASMINAKLFWDLLQAISNKTRIIISGDHKQLPPIGYGNIFSDVIDTLNSKYACKLSKVMRQAAMSGILSDANLIRENINPITEVMQPKLIHGELQDMYYLFRDNRQRLFDIAVKTFVKSVETDGIDNVVIITPRRKDCLNSAVELNKKIQDELIPSTEPSITCQDIEYRKGAKVMQIVNNYDENVFNGEIGFITDIRSENNGKKTVMVASVDFGGGKVIDYLQTEMAQLDLAYAVTVHKIQGSGIKTVIGIIDNSHYKLLDNCILYTLLTRAKKRCLLLAEPTAFNQCIRTSHNRRNTWIMEGAFKHR